MYKIVISFTFLLIFFASCVEGDLDMRGTYPTINFSFYNSIAAIYPDSVVAAGADSTYIFPDSLNSYNLPLRNDQEHTEFIFYLDSLTSEVTVQYQITPTYDIDIIRHHAVFKNATASNPDSLILVQNNVILCTAVSSHLESVALNCGDTLNLKTDETTLRLYF